MKRILYIVLFIVSVTTVIGQPTIRSGAIEFEKKVNRYALAQKSNLFKSTYESYKSRNSQFIISKSTFLFNNGKSLFAPSQSTGTIEMITSRDPFPFAGQSSRVYTDHVKQQSTSSKDLYNKAILIVDSLVPIKWKLTNEFREVAGYSCRRANGLILDSVYVVAFYTDAIHFSGGPETFNGLPGMILEVVLPHYHVSWTAISVTPQTIPIAQLVPPVSKAKPMNRKEVKEWCLKSLSAIGNELRELLEKGLLI